MHIRFTSLPHELIFFMKDSFLDNAEIYTKRYGTIQRTVNFFLNLPTQLPRLDYSLFWRTSFNFF